MSTTTKPNPVLKFLKELRPLEWSIIIIVLLFGGVFIWRYATPKIEPEKKPVSADTKVRIYEFWGQGCPHCAVASPFLRDLDDNSTAVELHQYETWYNRDNKDKNQKVADLLGTKAGGVPFIVIGDQVITGFDTEQTTGKEIKDRVDYCTQNQCPDKAGELLGFDKLIGFDVGE